MDFGNISSVFLQSTGKVQDRGKHSAANSSPRVPPARAHALASSRTEFSEACPIPAIRDIFL